MKLRIVLVEDNAMNLELHRDLLEADGHDVTACENGSEFQAWARSDALPDIILMDILLPDANGTELMRELKQDERRSRIPVVAVTAQALTGDVPRLMAAGFVAVLTKPIDTRSFVGTVSSLAKRPE